MSKMRHVIQIVHQPEGLKGREGMIALCDDGTIWFRSYGNHDNLPSSWVEIAPPPREEQSEFLRSAWD